MDLDGSGDLDANSDGVLLLRYLAGFRGEALTDGVTATTPAVVISRIREFMPTEP